MVTQVQAPYSVLFRKPLIFNGFLEGFRKMMQTIPGDEDGSRNKGNQDCGEYQKDSAHTGLPICMGAFRCTGAGGILLLGIYCEVLGNRLP